MSGGRRDWPSAGGSLGELIRTYDWNGTTLGPIDAWPAPLVSIVDLVLEAPRPMALLWGDDLVLIYNEPYARMIGDRHPAGLGGRSLACLDDARELIDPAIEAVRSGESRVLLAQRCDVVRAGRREEGWFDVAMSPLRDEHRRIVGVLTTLADVGERILAEASLEGCRTVLDLAEEEGQIGSWAIDLPHGSGRVERSPTVYRIFGVPEDPDQPVFFDHVHAEDRERIQLELAIAELTGIYATEFRIVRPDGEVRWLTARGRVLEAGGRRRLHGVIHDTTAQHRLEDDLRAARFVAHDILESIGEGFYALDAAWRFTYVNAAAEGLLGVRREDLLGGEIWALFPDLVGTRIEHEARAAAQDRGRRMFETHFKPWGRWFEIRVVAMEDGGLGIHFKDVTERREAAARQRLLMREVDHRAKNMLAVVQAVARLTRADSPQAFARAVIGRIEALARAHTLLAEASWSGADLATLIRAELSPWLVDGETRATLAGPALRIAGEAVQPLAMVVHELATNAARHGSLSTGEGRVDVAWSLDEASGVRLSWRETGGPRVAAPERRGFGSDLIMGAVLGQLRGTADLGWEPGGLRCTVTIPAERLLGESGGVRADEPSRRQLGRGVSLRGRRVLVAEDDALQGLALARDLSALGCEVVGPVEALEDALRLAASEPDLAVAVLDVDLRGRHCWTVADVLAERNVPVVFSTGRADLSARDRAEPVLEKPFTAGQLASALRTAIAGHTPR